MRKNSTFAANIEFLKYFNELGLIPALERVLVERAFTEPTDIQEQAIPILLEKPTDFIGLAQTGTGKTAAFGLPLLQKVDVANRSTQGIILCPTREIAIQTFKELSIFSKYLGKLNMENVYGGTPVMAQAKRIQKNAPHIIVGTPGRVIDLLERGSIDLSNVKYFILDEADEMLNMGFEQDIQKVLEFADDGASTWLFSATMPSSIRSIIKKYMKSPVEVSIDKGDKVNKNIKHMYTLINRENKFDKLTYIIDQAEDLYGVIFCRMKSDTEQLAEDLSAAGYKAEAINGDLSQSKREQVIKRFRSKKTNILVGSDVAARGLDIKNLTHVIHYALPDTFEYYTHRSGRTGRAGEDGISIAFIGRSEQGKIRQLEKSLNIKFEEYNIDLRPASIEEKVDQWIVKNSENITGADEKALKVLSEKLEVWSKEDLMSLIVNTQLGPTERELKYAGKSGDSDRFSQNDRGDRGDRRSRRQRDDFSDKRGEGRSNRREGGRDEKRSDKRKEGKSDKWSDKTEERKSNRRDVEGDSNKSKKKGKERDRTKDHKKEHKSSGTRTHNPDFTDIFINIGFSDGFGDIALQDFIHKNTGIAKSKIGSFEVNKRYSLFELDKGLAKKVDTLFEDVDLKGRRIIAKIDKDS